MNVAGLIANACKLERSNNILLTHPGRRPEIQIGGAWGDSTLLGAIGSGGLLGRQPGRFRCEGSVGRQLGRFCPAGSVNCQHGRFRRGSSVGRRLVRFRRGGSVGRQLGHFRHGGSLGYQLERFERRVSLGQARSYLPTSTCVKITPATIPES